MDKNDFDIDFDFEKDLGFVSAQPSRKGPSAFGPYEAAPGNHPIVAAVGILMSFQSLTSHWPYLLLPTATTVPSLFSPTV